ncbi:hypothetical protein ACKVWM_004953 [Pyricularia oryzae]
MVLAQPFHVWILFLTSAIALPTQIHHSAIQARDTDGLDTNSGQHQNAANPNSIKTLRAGTEPHKYPLKDAKVIELLRDPTLQFTKHYYCPHCKDGPMPTTDKVYQHIETHDPPLNTQTYVKGEDTKISFEKIKAKKSSWDLAKKLIGFSDVENPNRLRQQSRHPHQGHEENPLTTLRDQAIGPGDVEKAQGPGAGRAAWRTPDDGGPACPCSSFGAGCYQPCHVLHLIPARLADCGQGATVAAVTWEGKMVDPQMNAEQAGKEVVTVCRWVLGAEFAALPDYAGEAWNYHIRESGGE